MSLNKRQEYVTTLIRDTLRNHSPLVNPDIQFKERSSSIGASTYNYETNNPIIIFNHYWLKKLTYSELKNLTLHECAHIVSKEGHTKMFREACCRIGVPKRWSKAYTDDVEVMKHNKEK